MKAILLGLLLIAKIAVAHEDMSPAEILQLREANAAKKLAVGKLDAIQLVDQLSEAQLNELAQLHGATKTINKKEFIELIRRAKTRFKLQKAKIYEGISYPLLMDYTLRPYPQIYALKEFVSFGQPPAYYTQSTVYQTVLPLIPEERVERMLIHEASHIFGIGISNDLDSVYFSVRLIQLSNIMANKYVCGAYPSSMRDLDTISEYCSRQLVEIKPFVRILSISQQKKFEEFLDLMNQLNSYQIIYASFKEIILLTTEKRLVKFQIQRVERDKYMLAPFVAFDKDRSMCDSLGWPPDARDASEMRDASILHSQLLNQNILVPKVEDNQIEGYFSNYQKIMDFNTRKVIKVKPHSKSRSICFLRLSTY